MSFPRFIFIMTIRKVDRCLQKKRSLNILKQLLISITIIVTVVYRYRVKEISLYIRISHNWHDIRVYVKSLYGKYFLILSTTFVRDCNYTSSYIQLKSINFRNHSRNSSRYHSSKSFPHRLSQQTAIANASNNLPIIRNIIDRNSSFLFGSINHKITKEVIDVQRGWRTY